MKKFKDASKEVRSYLRSKDAFGTPITVNYKGEDTYKSLLGGLCSIAIFIFVLIQFIIATDKMVKREEPAYASYFLPKTRLPIDAMNVPSMGGQMYIAIKQVSEAKNGSVTEVHVPYDETFMNGKIDYFTNGQLRARVNLTACDDQADFNEKAKYTSGLSESDFDKMLCIPADKFNLYNSAEQNIANSISVLFEQCGGKYSGEIFPLGDISDLDSLAALDFIDLGLDQDIYGYGDAAVLDMSDTFSSVSDGSIAAGTDAFGSGDALSSQAASEASTAATTVASQSAAAATSQAASALNAASQLSGSNTSLPLNTTSALSGFSSGLSGGIRRLQFDTSAFSNSIPSSSNLPTTNTLPDTSSSLDTSQLTSVVPDPSSVAGLADSTLATATEAATAAQSSGSEALSSAVNDATSQAQALADTAASAVADAQSQAEALANQATSAAADLASAQNQLIGSLSAEASAALASTVAQAAPGISAADLGAYASQFEQWTPAKREEKRAGALASLGFGPTPTKAVVTASGEVFLQPINNCKSADEMRNYMADKVIVVYAADSYIAQEDQEPNDNELITYLTPIVEKKLDWRSVKSVNTLIQEINMEIQDSYWQIFNPDPQEVEYTQTVVYNEDTQTREYLTMMPQSSPYLTNTRDPMLSVNFKLDTTVRVQERTAYDTLTLFGDIGGLNDFIFLIIAPTIAFLIGSRYNFDLLKSMYLVNDADPQDDLGDGSSERRSNWTKRTEKFKWSWMDVLLQNDLVQLAMCRKFRPKNKREKILEIGQDRVDAQLDVRSLMMTQNVLLVLMKLLVKERSSRKMLKAQRKLNIIEPNKWPDADSSDDEADFITKNKDKKKTLKKVLEMLDGDGGAGMNKFDEDTKALIKGLFMDDEAAQMESARKKMMDPPPEENHGFDEERTGRNASEMTQMKDASTIELKSYASNGVVARAPSKKFTTDLQDIEDVLNE